MKFVPKGADATVARIAACGTSNATLSQAPTQTTWDAPAEYEPSDEHEVYQYQSADQVNAQGIKFRLQNCKRRFLPRIVDLDFGLQRISHGIFLRVLYRHDSVEKLVAGSVGVGVGLAGHSVSVVGSFIKRENHPLGCRPIPGIMRAPKLSHPQSAGKSDQEDQNEPKHAPYHV